MGEIRVDISHDTYLVAWSPEDGEFVASRLELPSLSWLAATQVDALEGLESMVAAVVSDMEAEGEEVPVPLAERRFSGKFKVRVGEHLHRHLARHAAEDGMSVNQYVVRKLASG